MTLLDRMRALWTTMQAAPAQPPIRIPIVPDHVLDIPQGQKTPAPRPAPKPLVRDADYFQVRVNELFLANQREWATRFDPMVVALTEFTYDGVHSGVPTIVGPSLLKDKLPVPTPEGMIYEDTRVAGLHPFRGGQINMAIVLCRVVRKDVVRDLLGTVESLAGALDPTHSLATYLKLGRTIVDGLEKVFGMDGDNQPLVGRRFELDSDSKPISPGYHVLVNAPEGSFQADRFYVLNDRLAYDYGPPHGLLPFRNADYVLYCLERPAAGERSDVDQLPFYPMLKQAKSEAANGSDEAWRNAKAILATVYQMAVASPDLTFPQAQALRQKWADDLKLIRTSAVQNANLGSRQPESIAQRDGALAILDMA